MTQNRCGLKSVDPGLQRMRNADPRPNVSEHPFNLSGSQRRWTSATDRTGNPEPLYVVWAAKDVLVSTDTSYNPLTCGMYPRGHGLRRVFSWAWVSFPVFPTSTSIQPRF